MNPEELAVVFCFLFFFVFQLPARRHEALRRACWVGGNFASGHKAKWEPSGPEEIGQEEFSVC